MEHMSDLPGTTVKCNILLIGKSGAGKSAFANYLFGVYTFKTGTGAPVTTWEENFQHHFVNIHDVQVNVYDSVGLEQNNFSEWMRKLNGFLSTRQVCSSPGILWRGWSPIRSSQDILSANDIMHVLFYVVNGAGARIEANELKILSDIQKSYKIPASLVITNCDVATKAQIEALEKEARKNGLESIRVCSISRKTRGGEKTEPFGKENALRKILSASYEKVGRELTIIVYKQMIEFTEKIQNTLKGKIDSSDISIFKIDELDSSLDNITEFLDEEVSKLNDVSDFLPPAYRSYYNFIEDFDVDYQGRNVFEESFEKISNFIDNFDMDNLALMRRVNKAMEDLEDGNVFDKIGAFFTMASTALFLKENIKNAIDEAFGEIKSKLFSQLWEIERS